MSSTWSLKVVACQQHKQFWIHTNGLQLVLCDPVPSLCDRVVDPHHCCLSFLHSKGLHACLAGYVQECAYKVSTVFIRYSKGIVTATSRGWGSCIAQTPPKTGCRSVFACKAPVLTSGSCRKAQVYTWCERITSFLRGCGEPWQHLRLFSGSVKRCFRSDVTNYNQHACYRYAAVQNRCRIQLLAMRVHCNQPELLKPCPHSLTHCGQKPFGPVLTPVNVRKIKSAKPQPVRHACCQVATELPGNQFKNASGVVAQLFWLESSDFALVLQYSCCFLQLVLTP